MLPLWQHWATEVDEIFEEISPQYNQIEFDVLPSRHEKPHGKAKEHTAPSSAMQHVGFARCSGEPNEVFRDFIRKYIAYQDKAVRINT